MNKKRYEDNRRVNIVLDKRSREIGDKICAKYEMSLSGVIRLLFNNYNNNILSKTGENVKKREITSQQKELQEIANFNWLEGDINE